MERDACRTASRYTDEGGISLSQFGTCSYYAQRGELCWCILKKVTISDETYQRHCGFGAEVRCPLRRDLTFSELARRRRAVRRLMQEGQGRAWG